MDAKQAIFPQNEYLFPAAGEWCRIVVGCHREDYSASRIAHAVEDCNAHLLNLNVTSGTPGPALEMGTEDTESNIYPVTVDLRVDLRDHRAVSRSLERYGYTVLEVSASEEDNADITTPIANLIRYLNV